MDTMKSFGLRTLVLAVILVMSGIAIAASPHFVNSSFGVTLDGDGVCAWKEAGLGNNTLISYTCSADYSAQWGCVNKGGKHPQAANKEDVSGVVSASGEFSSGQNGQISGTLSFEPQGSSLSCPGNQKLVLLCAQYSNATLVDETNNVVAFSGLTVSFVDPRFGQLCSIF